ncbi:MAG: class I SAM-dependent methyltransferase [Verrucomicrobiaceae bacterium]|nr:MAG: class I SAM-dependent methyltransferase [Verrucomicrobiaceae bacterium]
MWPLPSFSWGSATRFRAVWARPLSPGLSRSSIFRPPSSRFISATRSKPPSVPPEASSMSAPSSADLGPHPDFPNSRVVHDPAIGFYRTNPYPSEDDLSAFYTQEYRAIRQESPTPAYVAFMKRRAEEQSRFILKHSTKRRFTSVIDVGCGCGELLNAMHDHADTCTGFETDVVMARHATENRPSDRVHIRNEHFMCKTAGLCGDLLAMSHVFEHIPEPTAFLTDLRKTTLVQGGMLFLEVPNDPLYWIKDQLARRHRGLGHVNYFTTASLATLLMEAGFNVIKTRTCGMTIQEHIRSTNPGKLARLQTKLVSRIFGEKSVHADLHYFVDHFFCREL